MKICISSKGNKISDEMDPRFGRCANLIVYDTDSGEFESAENSSVQLSGGAGIQTAQFIVSKGVKAVISGSFGPNAFNTLKAAGIEMYTAAGGTVEDVIKNFKEGKLKKSEDAGASFKH
ncbi:MAG: NifB/NifX family molybdenum-iron cluster-binding protein [Candidatus Goldbacteria bacterium]|nr:NifB/NifX family molybdenum-iron cluster-binding protein [Candidatus Goldiibacteriota bacterium]